MAKKARTPKPPRPAATGERRVQAPQRRAHAPRKSSTQGAPPFGIQHFWPIAAGALAIVVVAIVVPIVLTRGPSKPAPLALTKPVDWSSLPGLQTSKPPWPANAALLTARIPSIGLDPLGQEQLAFHIHQHLDLFVNGKRVTVPQYVGIQINSQAQTATFAELHTHLTDGVIHNESARNVRFTLAQFFAVWGVRLTSKCVGSFKGSCDNLHAWLNGKPVANPAAIVLKSHEEIEVSIGKPVPKVISHYDFPAGE
ncbi:MAG TPA: hypothetical protein VLJ76_00370 [Gaiellaceae bacterium]|nr:hypothetical protein [Gaiellaceae bacterium]